MELYQLKSFVTVARAQNLTKAANLLNVSQSALSTQLKALEEEFGVALFTRLPRGMELTDAGRVLLTYAQEVLDGADALAEKARALGRPARATVTIGLNADPTFLRVSAINRRLAEDAPDLDVIFLTSQTIRTPQMLRQGTIDLGFIYGEPAEPGIRHAKIADVEIVVALPVALAREGENLGWKEVAALPWIWVGHDSPFYEVMAERMASRGLAPNRKVATVDEQITRELLLAGQGVAMIRADEAAPMLEAGRIVLWPEGGLTMALSLAWLAGSRRLGLIERVRGAVEAAWR